jgi:leucyl-tRNA synthetase
MRVQSKFTPSDFESKWQKVWEEQGIYQPNMRDAKRPFYNLMMYPYPSAEGLHVGNMYAFTGADIYGRFKRMHGFDVFEPIGLDGFGIHSENYALKIGKHPKEQAKVSEANFYRQLHMIGNGFAFKHSLETYDPDYYRWTQWIFVQMFKHGLAYRKKSPLNFCPSCKTVLSDEQVINGACERCKTLVEKREMEQWFFRITAYAEKLLQNTYKESFKWSEKVKIGQRNWIGKKEGINITYPVIAGPAASFPPASAPYVRAVGSPSSRVTRVSDTIICFTTRPDTNFGATFVVIAPEHPFVASLLSSKTKEIRDYVDKARKKSEIERIAEGRKKTGVFTGFYCLNQLNNYKMPLYISDFVLPEFGTGAVVGVPGHDLRDFEFAKEFNLPIVRVVVGKDGDKSEITKPEQVQEEGTMINSGFLNGLDIHAATEKIMNHLEEKGWGKRMTTYKLRDWCVSRQRYWGAPIPMVFCKKCARLPDGQGWVPVPEKDLPVLLPDLTDWKPEGTGKGPLAKLESFIKTKCPRCGGDADRESDVCDTFLDSSWYFFRYPSTRAADSEQVPWDPEITKKWLPVTQYIGGAEHTVLHLLYSRFVTMAFHDWGLIDFDEPYENFYAHGLIIAEGAKMSKSKGNIVVPDEYINKYGADTLRTYLMFLGPFDQGGDFRDTGIAGMYRFLGRVWRLVTEFLSSSPKSPNEEDLLNRVTHQTIKEVTDDLEKLRYNTAIAHLMEFVNALSDNRQLITENHIKSLLLMLAPFAPHMTEELWNRTKNGEEKNIYSSIHVSSWPSYDPKYLEEDTVTIIVQVNGKLRETMRLQKATGTRQQAIEEKARKSEKVAKHLTGKTVRKTIFVSGKLINFVVT